jgi:hypothetical protein
VELGSNQKRKQASLADDYISPRRFGLCDRHPRRTRYGSLLLIPADPCWGLSSYVSRGGEEFHTQFTVVQSAVGGRYRAVSGIAVASLIFVVGGTGWMHPGRHKMVAYI